MFRLGRFLGHEVIIAWPALLLALIYVSQIGNLATGLLFAAATFFSIFVHELGHAVAATRFRCGPCRIVLHGLGGETIHRRARNDNHSIYISLAGPAAGMALGLLVWGLSQTMLSKLPPIGAALVDWMLWVNIVWSILNLLPIYPLDGGHVSEVLLKNSLGREQGRRATAIVSVVTLVGLLIFASSRGYSIKSPLTIFLIVTLLFQNWNLYNGRDSQGLGGY
jgi:stage IV sporulation protein FB